ncbi:unnamed protein product [Spirodela intermedia]|uniref:Strictosidine synthase conserved region domain-containing protein n=1 Tax=Spirodela intermedia TaxID=51605 RepID=A0A7I8J9I2_SPIIN|nr:unnamed protein product [Spirodela intermedia]CAA6666749.1 unnamed protein product [Spirodela intermedia]
MTKPTVFGFVLAVLVAAPASVLVALYRSEDLDPAPLPGGSSDQTSSVPEIHSGILKASEKVGEGLLPGPEDLAYDAASGFLYTGCDDGWIRRIKLRKEGETAKEGVEDWAYVGGRPLGIAFGPDKQLLVASAYKGLVSVGEDRAVRLLAEEADGLRFGVADGVDVASDGTVYFTDASYKYNLATHMLDIMEGRPHGRLMSFDPATARTEVLLSGLYFANGVAMSPDQGSVIFCETPLRRCRRYHVRGEKKGAVDHFVDSLPGLPDNIRYDDEGRFWIGLCAGKSKSWDLMLRYPMLRKMVVVSSKLADFSHHVRKGAGVLSVSLEGEPLALYTDRELSLSTGGLRVGRHLYYASLVKSYISRIPLDELAAGKQ